MKTIIKVTKHILVLLALITLQLSIIPVFGGALSELNVIFVVIIFCAVAYSFPLAIFYAAALALILDLYSALPFGTLVSIFLFIVFLLREIFEKLFTNKSYYSIVVIAGLGLLFLKFSLLTVKSLLYFVNTKDITQISQMLFAEWNSLPLYFISNLLLTSVLFIIFHLTSKRFKAVFVDTIRK